MPRGRKLYYDVALTAGAPSAQVSPTLTPDRNGAVLDTLPALDGNAGAGERDRQELTAVFMPYHWTPPPPPPDEFMMTNYGPPDGPYVGYLFIVLNGMADPSTVILGDTIVASINSGGYSGLSVEVVANEIRIHNTDGEGGDHWEMGGQFSVDLFDTILEEGTARPLVPTSANWFFA